MKVNFTVLEGGTMPTKANGLSAGIDIYSAEDKIIPAMESRSISTQLFWSPESEEDDEPYTIYWLNIRSRSGMAFKRNLECSTAGVIDEDYRGEIKVMIRNVDTCGNQIIKKGDKIAQGIVEKAIVPTDIECLSKCARGGNGFGSSDRLESSNE